MTVADLIAGLQTMPQDATVHDCNRGILEMQHKGAIVCFSLELICHRTEAAEAYMREAEQERAMTHAELMAIPEWPTGLGHRDIEVDGKRVRVPVAPPRVAMFDPMGVTDALGHQWLLGTYKGVRYRQLLHANPAVAFQEKP
jgi:hypothetical protein